MMTTQFVRVDTLVPGAIVDLEPLLRRYVGEDPSSLGETPFAMATVESVELAESVDGVASVVLATDLGNVKVPAAEPIESVGPAGRPGRSYLDAQNFATASGQPVHPGQRVIFPVGDMARSMPQFNGHPGTANYSTLIFHPDGTVVLTVDTSAGQPAATLAAAREILQVGADVLGISRRRMHWDSQTFRTRVAIDAAGNVLTDMAANPVPRGPLDSVCPACNALPGRPCTQPTDTGRRAVAWVHSSREVAAE